MHLIILNRLVSVAEFAGYSFTCVGNLSDSLSQRETRIPLNIRQSKITLHSTDANQIAFETGYLFAKFRLFEIGNSSIA